MLQNLTTTYSKVAEVKWVSFYHECHASVCFSGQTVYFDIGTQIQRDGVQESSISSSDRTICFDGTNVYYTSGGQIFMVGSNTPVIDRGEISKKMKIVSANVI